MQQTHDAAFISTYLRNAVPHIYVGLRLCKKGYKLNWNAKDSMRRKIGSNAILQEILKMQLVTGDVANSWGSSLQIWPKNCKIAMLLSAMHLNRPWTRLTEAWGACKAQWNCKFPGRSATIGRMQKKQYGKKCRKCKVSGEMLQTHDAVMSSTHVRSLRSHAEKARWQEIQKKQSHAE